MFKITDKESTIIDSEFFPWPDVYTDMESLHLFRGERVTLGHCICSSQFRDNQHRHIEL